MEVVAETTPLCRQCGQPIDLSHNFCSSCGEWIKPAPDEKEKLAKYLNPSLLFYFICVVLIGIYSLTEIFDYSFKHAVIVDVIFSVLTLAFAFYGWKELVGLYKVGRLKVGIMTAIIVLSTGAALAVDVVVDFLNASLYDYELFETAVYRESSHPLLFAILFIGVQPAVFEEMAFRGFLFNNFKKMMNPKATLIATSILFGVLHFSLIGLLWLIPIGLVLGWLRMKYQNLWYAMLAHFTYNTTIVFIEFL